MKQPSLFAVLRAYWTEIKALRKLGAGAYKRHALNWIRRNVGGGTAWAVGLYVNEDLGPMQGAVHLAMVVGTCKVMPNGDPKEYAKKVLEEALKALPGMAQKAGVPEELVLQEFHEEWARQEAAPLQEN